MCDLISDVIVVHELFLCDMGHIGLMRV